MRAGHIFLIVMFSPMLIFVLFLSMFIYLPYLLMRDGVRNRRPVFWRSFGASFSMFDDLLGSLGEVD